MQGAGPFLRLREVAQAAVRSPHQGWDITDMMSDISYNTRVLNKIRLCYIREDDPVNVKQYAAL